MNDLSLLEYFVAVYHRGSFRTAADSLGVSQSAVTKGIRRLEDELGLRLFNRTTRVVQPTENARQLLKSARASLAAMEEFMEHTRLLTGGGQGELRVGVTAIAADLFIADCLAQLSKTHPDLEVEVVVGSADVYQDLATGRCDVAIGDEANFQASPHAPALRMVPLKSEPLVVVFRKKHPGGKTSITELLRNFPWAVPSRYFNENRPFSSLASQVSQSARFPRYRLSSLSSCLQLASASDVVTLAPLSKARARDDLDWSDFDLEMDVKLAIFTVANNPPTLAATALNNALRSLLAA